MKGLTPEEFGKKSVLRNANIANLFHRIGYIEKMGTGITRMQNLMEEAKLEPIKFRFTTFVTASFIRKFIIETAQETVSQLGKKAGEKVGVKVGEKVGVKVGEELTNNQQKIVTFMRRQPSINAIILSEKVGISKRKIEENIRKLKEKGILKRVGPDKGGHWEIIEK